MSFQQKSTPLKPLPRSFFARDPRRVARELLGKSLVRRESGLLLLGRIVETEAYLGVDDAAAHAYSGLTPRNAVLFGPPGHAYVYFTYGMHYCMNISCQPEGQAGCVLLRALEPLLGMEQMAVHRGLELNAGPTAARLRSIAGGPARLCEALGITRERDNGKDVCGRGSDLQVVEGELRYQPRQIAATPRIGITRAAGMLLRFIVRESPFLSR